MTRDVAGAKAFYQKLFNWKYKDMPEEQIPYTVVEVNDDEVGGIMAIPPEAGDMPPVWGLYITVDDVDATVEEAVSLGGKICKPPWDIPGVGRMCVMEDPQGAFISIVNYRCEGS
jgi:predicted enzyme related to lactoylglutathione lyase